MHRWTGVDQQHTNSWPACRQRYRWMKVDGLDKRTTKPKRNETTELHRQLHVRRSCQAAYMDKREDKRKARISQTLLHSQAASLTKELSRVTAYTTRNGLHGFVVWPLALPASGVTFGCNTEGLAPFANPHTHVLKVVARDEVPQDPLCSARFSISSHCTLSLRVQGKHPHQPFIRSSSYYV